MDIRSFAGWTVRGLSQVSVILGKNGSGKSTLLRALDAHASATNGWLRSAYITPERSGSLQYQAHVEQNVQSSQTYLSDQRRRNQFVEFKQQSVLQYRNLAMLVSEEVDNHLEQGLQGKPTTFSAYLSRLNSLLDNVEVKRNGPNFDVVNRSTGDKISVESISSGESELIALAIEALVFAKQSSPGNKSILILDEPDVHLHPDLQGRLIQFLVSLAREKCFRLLIATHSTALIGALSSVSDVRVAYLATPNRELRFRPVSHEHRRLIPVFGAHPLTQVFNEAPPLLVEGEDDERLWLQAVRSSKGRLSLFPVVCETVQDLTAHERVAKDILEAVYDGARIFSLRDGDGKVGDLNDDGPVVRLRLQCYAAENLLLTDEVLEALGLTWVQLKERIEVWLQQSAGHPHHSAMEALSASGYDRRHHKIKEIRNDLLGLIATTKPWEVAVGQVVAALRIDPVPDYQLDGSIYTYLGTKVANALLK